MRERKSLPEYTPPNVPPQRLEELKDASTRMIDVFRDARTIGTTITQPPFAVMWPYVRYLVWDRIRPEIGQGESTFKHANWHGKFATDLASIAQRVSAEIPEDITDAEWVYMSLESYKTLFSRSSTKELWGLKAKSIQDNDQYERFFKWASDMS